MNEIISPVELLENYTLQYATSNQKSRCCVGVTNYHNIRDGDIECDEMEFDQRFIKIKTFDSLDAFMLSKTFQERFSSFCDTFFVNNEELFEQPEALSVEKHTSNCTNLIMRQSDEEHDEFKSYSEEYVEKKVEESQFRFYDVVFTFTSADFPKFRESLLREYKRVVECYLNDTFETLVHTIVHGENVKEFNMLETYSTSNKGVYVGRALRYYRKYDGTHFTYFDKRSILIERWNNIEDFIAGIKLEKIKKTFEFFDIEDSCATSALKDVEKYIERFKKIGCGDGNCYVNDWPYEIENKNNNDCKLNANQLFIDREVYTFLPDDYKKVMIEIKKACEDKVNKN